jgi:hypothetical protein
MTSHELTFCAERHEYRLNGRVLPSVTQVLRFLDDFEHVPPAVLEAARQFGSHVHAACDLDARDVLDYDALDPALRPYVDAFRRFRAEAGIEILGSEERVCSRTFGYAGTLDLRARRRNAKVSTRDMLIDIKSGVVPRSVGAQCAAYDAAWYSMHGGTRHDRFCLQLRSDATYRLHPLTNTVDFSVFLSCLNLHKVKEQPHAA